MFGNFGQLAGLMTKLPKIKEEIEKLQQRLGQLTAEGDAGAGMVRVRMNGKFGVLAVTISDEAIQGKDKELLEDLIVAASNQAVEKVKQLVAAETSKVASELGLPPGFNIPGLT
jgi:DNA-binding YbaB/EbfC family protein